MADHSSAARRLTRCQRMIAGLMTLDPASIMTFAGKTMTVAQRITQLKADAAVYQAAVDAQKVASAPAKPAASNMERLSLK